MTPKRKQAGRNMPIDGKPVQQERPKSVLNIGGGNKRIPIPTHYEGWRHVLLDVDPSGDPDIVLDARELTTLPTAVYDAVYFSHCLEHFHHHEVPRVLDGIRHVLKDDGFAEIRVPNLRGAMEFMLAKGMDLEDVAYTSPAGPITFRDMCYGFSKAIERSGVDFMCHKTGFSEKSLAAVLRRCGFAPVLVQRDPMDRLFGLRALAFKQAPTEEQRSFLRIESLGLQTSENGKTGGEGHFDKAYTLHRAGDLKKAEESYRVLLNNNPNSVAVLCNLGALLRQTERPHEAVDLYRKAIDQEPGNAMLYANLGRALADMHRYKAASEAYREALAIDPGLEEVYANLGRAEFNLNPRKTSESAIEETFHKATNLHRQGNRDEAERLYRGILRSNPDYVPAVVNLGVLMRESGRPTEAIEYYQKALALEPGNASTLGKLGHLLANLGHYEEALNAFRRATESDPESAPAHDNLGFVLMQMNRYDEAAVALKKAVEINPSDANAWNNLGSVYQRQCLVDEGIACHRRAIDLRPGFIMAHSNVLFDMHFSHAYTPEEMAEAHKEWSRRHEKPLRRKAYRHSPRDSKQKPLRVGFVSPNFEPHPVSYFLAPIFRVRDPQEWQAVCYSDVLTRNRISDKFRRQADTWRDIAGLKDDEVADLVRKDEIDVLVDLAGHTGHNRLLVFARKPAPVQVSWIGYFDTTGLEAMDYLIADATCLPQEYEHLYTEKIIRLPDGFLCYDRPSVAPEVNALPALERGYITFGSFNQLAKVQLPVVEAWAKLLEQVQSARLVMRCKALGDKSVRERYARLFEALGVSRDRLDLLPGTSLKGYFESYHQIDISLDPFPFVGGTTTCDSLWMGVPVVTFTGDRFCSRHSASHIRNVGLGKLVAEDLDGYLELAAELAGDLGLLVQIRATLREMCAKSPLFDAERFHRNFVNALRQMWKGSA